jgi:hypothetical protein
MRRVALALVLGLLISVPAASSRSAFDWKHLKYFSHESQHLLVATDGSWGEPASLRPDTSITPPSPDPSSAA